MRRGAHAHDPIYRIKSAKQIYTWISRAKIIVLRMRWDCRERFPRHRIKRKPIVSDPGMHHGTCVTHLPWCTSGSLFRGGGKTFPVFPAHAQPTILRIWQEARELSRHDTGLVLLQYSHSALARLNRSVFSYMIIRSKRRFSHFNIIPRLVCLRSGYVITIDCATIVMTSQLLVNSDVITSSRTWRGLFQFVRYRFYSRPYWRWVV